ncbi:hypothetical protein JR316_0001383 [Psilocybe cubensis]|uniref:Uncharacterized protein n=2 Tax=Psilocybe cubensis TaxID=181762 RepID=A0ACB8HIZ9_PSICU|nr:hypothetical protein JR316_0001383 [Psilocybe cubensis]KAH9487310.1 hypothetical protein JR316_0001383 [Psilocybe cubensis]
MLRRKLIENDSMVLSTYDSEVINLGLENVLSRTFKPSADVLKFKSRLSVSVNIGDAIKWWIVALRRCAARTQLRRKYANYDDGSTLGEYFAAWGALIQTNVGGADDLGGAIAWPCRPLASLYQPGPFCSEPSQTTAKSTTAMLSILCTLAASTSLVLGYGVGGLQRRAGQTTATCTKDFVWMDNAHNASPCQVVAQLDALCNGGNWVIPSLTSGRYNNPDPSAGTATLCTCSWASYNLISACTMCQNATSTVAMWDDYSSMCSGKLSTTCVFWSFLDIPNLTDSTNRYFPSNYTLPTDLTIPFWAGTDPTTWPSRQFNVASAQQIARENHADLGQAPPPSNKKSTNVGAIVGGVIGGLVVIAAAVAAALYILRRQRKSAPGTVPLSGMPGHMRSMSDVTTSSQAYTTLGSAPFRPPTSPTIFTHNTSVRSVPFMSSVAPTAAPYGATNLPPVTPPVTTSPPPGNRVEDVIEPFVTPPQQANIGHDRKQSNGSGFPIYDSPSAPPVGGMRMDVTRPTTPSQSQRTGRYNPPAYSESSRNGGNRPAHRGKQASSDTLQSLTSSRNHGARTTPAHSPNSSASGMANISGQLPVTNNESTSNRANTPGHGRQVSASNDSKRHPSGSESISGRDIA